MSLTLTHCMFKGNTSVKAGGGMYNGFSSPTITDCTFSSNHSDDGAGAMCNNFRSTSTVSNCLFVGNTAGTAAGIGNINGSSPTVTNCVFSGNSASGAFGAGTGGAFYNNDSNPIITHCTFSGNTAAVQGGAMSNLGSSPTLINCIFSGNKVTDGVGGAITNSEGSNGTATNCLFIGNSATFGGGIVFGSIPALPVTLTLTNCTFAGNSADFLSGGLVVSGSASATVDNCVFWGNSDGGAMDEAAQILLNNGGEATVTFTDILGLTQSLPFCELCGEAPQVCCNDGTPNGNIGVDPKFLGGPSGISWNEDAVYCAPSCPADPLCHDCDDPLIEVGQTLFTDAPGTWTGDLTGMFLNPDTAQPLQSLIVSNTPTTVTVWGDFADLGQNNETYQINDYRLDSPTSPCIDAGDNNAIASCSRDLDGNERFFDDPNVFPNPGVGSPEHPEDIVDMGAYEFGGDPELDCDGNGLSDSCCAADFNFDGIVDAFDLATLLGDWGPCPEPCTPGTPDCSCQADFDNDCSVEAFDLANLLGSWGACQ